MKLVIMSCDRSSGEVGVLSSAPFAERADALAELERLMAADGTHPTCDVFLVDIDTAVPVVVVAPAPSDEEVVAVGLAEDLPLTVVEPLEPVEHVVEDVALAIVPDWPPDAAAQADAEREAPVPVWQDAAEAFVGDVTGEDAPVADTPVPVAAEIPAATEAAATAAAETAVAEEAPQTAASIAGDDGTTDLAAALAAVLPEQPQVLRLDDAGDTTEPEVQDAEAEEPLAPDAATVATAEPGAPEVPQWPWDVPEATLDEAPAAESGEAGDEAPLEAGWIAGLDDLGIPAPPPVEPVSEVIEPHGIMEAASAGAPAEAAPDPAPGPDALGMTAYTCDDCVYVNTCPNHHQKAPTECGSFQWKSM